MGGADGVASARLSVDVSNTETEEIVEAGGLGGGDVGDEVVGRGTWTEYGVGDKDAASPTNVHSETGAA